MSMIHIIHDDDCTHSWCSLTASKDAFQHWIAVVIHPNDGQHYKTMHLLDQDWNARAPLVQISDVVSTDSKENKMCPTFLSAGK